MNTTSIKQFHGLKSTILNHAAEAVSKIAPNEVKNFVETFKSLTGPQPGLDALSKIKYPDNFNKLKQICIDILDVELQMQRINNSLFLLNGEAAHGLNKGEWVDYHFSVWMLFTQGLLFRFERLVKDIIRGLIKPKNNNYKLVETDIMQKIHVFKKNIAEIRDPIAHTRGAADGIAESPYLEVYIFLGKEINVKYMFEPMEEYREK